MKTKTNDVYVIYYYRERENGVQYRTIHACTRSIAYAMEYCEEMNKVQKKFGRNIIYDFSIADMLGIEEGEE